MNEERAEAISALMDGELAEAPARRAVDALLQDPALREQWRRHHAIGDALRGGHVAGAGVLAERLREMLDREPVRLAPRRAGPPRVRRRHIATLAASVAILGLVLTFSLVDRRSTSPDGETLAEAGPGAPNGSAGALPASLPPAPGADRSALTRLTWNDPSPQVEQRLNGYLLNHNEYLATGVRGLLPYARVVGYDARY